MNLIYLIHFGFCDFVVYFIGRLHYNSVLWSQWWPWLHWSYKLSVYTRMEIFRKWIIPHLSKLPM